MQHVSDLHPKFTLRPHHMWKYGIHPNRQGKKERMIEEDRRNHRAKI